MSNTEKIIAEIQRLRKDLDGYSAEEALDYIESYVNLNSREPSLPADIDDAAEEYGNKEYPDEPALEQWGTGDYEPPVDNEYPREIAKDAFKAGAEWMDGQGEIIEGEVVATSTNGWESIRINKKLHSVGDKVIVQIRKK